MLGQPREWNLHNVALASATFKEVDPTKLWLVIVMLPAIYRPRTTKGAVAQRHEFDREQTYAFFAPLGGEKRRPGLPRARLNAKLDHHCYLKHQSRMVRFKHYEVVIGAQGHGSGPLVASVSTTRSPS